MTRILLAEDDPNLGTLLQEYLSMKGYKTDLATDGNQALSMFVAQAYDICLFDVMMPKKDGFTLTKEIRMSNAQVPIIFLTAKSQKEDTLQGFRIGADDFMTKPFSMEELIARIEAVLRRTKVGETEEVTKYTIADFEFDYQHQQLFHNGESTKLTGKEAELLKLLCQNKGRALSRAVALKTIWGDDSYFNARSMDVYITKLRKFFKANPSIQIVNLHGEGFKLLTESTVA
jgi:DNA-binding response OmpR family regulator